jgi:hypothetical protein
MKRSETVMEQFLLTILLVVSLVGSAKAQEASGDSQEVVKNEVMKVENDKQLALKKGMSAVAEWFERVNTTDLTWVGKVGIRTKAEVVADMKSGNQKVVPVRTYDYKVRVHGTGNTTAVLTYRTNNISTVGGKQITGREEFVTDIYVKENGAWVRIVHDSNPVPNQ